MNRRSRVLMLVAAALLVLVRWGPLWEVRLHAPQYPEGLGLHIRVNTVDGLKSGDLQSINGLNHYIGMRAIEPDAIPELRWMPWIVAAFGVAAVTIAISGWRPLLMGWLLAFACLGAVGIWDFWRWEHNYGHNLDMEAAIIIVPGMTYQPPLVGSKQLLNFRATAWPGTGAAAMGGSFLLGVVALAMSRRRKRAA
ncbi:MAG: hypothetical protein ABJC19_09450 [Gemmatimonadota bacterium]